MYVLINPGDREEMVQCAHTTWNHLRSLATLEIFGIPTPRTVRPGTPSEVRMRDGAIGVGGAVHVNTARRTIVIPRDAKEVRLISDTGGVIRRYYWDREARAPVEEEQDTSERSDHSSADDRSAFAQPEPENAGGLA